MRLQLTASRLRHLVNIIFVLWRDLPGPRGSIILVPAESLAGWATRYALRKRGLAVCRIIIQRLPQRFAEGLDRVYSLRSSTEA